MGDSSRLLMVVLLAAAPACLGDTTDQTQPVDTGVLGSPKVTRSVHDTVVFGVSQPRQNDFSRTFHVDEACFGCSITAMHHFDGQFEQIAVFSDQTGEQLCAVTLGPKIDTILVDTCDILNDAKSLAAM